MVSKPKWVTLLSPDLRPDERQIKELEKLRVTFGIPHEALYWRVMSSPTTTRRVQRSCLATLRIRNPQASEKELLRMVFLSRIRTPPIIEMTKEAIDQAMKNINSFDDLCDYIIKLDEREPPSPDPFGIGKRIDEMLAQEEEEKDGN